MAKPHQIGTAERAHGILLPTVRSLMAFANATYSMWARCLCWACMLANITAVDYNTSTPFIPLLLTEAHIDKRKILPFGCLAIVHRSKEQVIGGKLDVRGIIGAFIGLADNDSFKLGIKVLAPDGTIISTAFYTFDETYFPWRKAGERRLHNDGTFGSELETSSVYRDQHAFSFTFDYDRLFTNDEDWRILVTGFLLTYPQHTITMVLLALLQRDAVISANDSILR